MPMNLKMRNVLAIDGILGFMGRICDSEHDGLAESAAPCENIRC